MAATDQLDRMALYLQLILTVLHPFLIPLAGMTALLVIIVVKRAGRKGNDGPYESH